MSSLTETPHTAGHLGFQKLPWVVCLGPHVLWLESGVHDADKRAKPAICRDAYLPMVVQRKNEVRSYLPCCF